MKRHRLQAPYTWKKEKSRTDQTADNSIKLQIPINEPSNTDKSPCSPTEDILKKIIANVSYTETDCSNAKEFLYDLREMLKLY